MTPFRRFSNTLELPESARFPAFEWEVDNEDLLVRPQDGDVQTVWAYLGRGKIATKLQNPRTLRTSRNKIVGAFNSRRMWRMWPLDSGECAFLRGEFGLIRLPDERELVRFELPRKEFTTALEAFEASAERVQELLERLQQDPASDWHVAKAWREVHRNSWDILEWKLGTIEQLEELLRALAHLFLDPSHGDYWGWFPLADVGERIDLLQPFAMAFVIAGHEKRLQRLLALLDTEFEVSVEAQKWRGYDFQGDPSWRKLPSLKFSPPTMHERMESLLILRDWLGGKMSDTEIQAILS